MAALHQQRCVTTHQPAYHLITLLEQACLFQEHKLAQCIGQYCKNHRKACSLCNQLLLEIAITSIKQFWIHMLDIGKLCMACDNQCNFMLLPTKPMCSRIRTLTQHSLRRMPLSVKSYVCFLQAKKLGGHHRAGHFVCHCFLSVGA